MLCTPPFARNGHTSLMAHLVAGYPSLTMTGELMKVYIESGVDILEIQIPFSDPMGDGPIIREACAHALRSGLTVKNIFSFLAEQRGYNRSVPICLMSYFNIIFRYGVEAFCRAASAVGITGLIVPDYPWRAETRERFGRIAENYGLIVTRFLSLDCSLETMRDVADAAAGFVYCFSRRGITGGYVRVDHITAHLDRLRSRIPQPIAVGFGIANTGHIRQLKNHVDMLIVGSAFLRAYDEGGPEAVKRIVGDFTGALGSNPHHI